MTNSKTKSKVCFKKGDKVRVINHHGSGESTGRIVHDVEIFSGHQYWDVKMTGGRGRGMQMRFLASQMVKI